MDRLDLNLVPIAVALYDELSVSRAAQKLGMSQPAVSMALRRMRATFNDPLFIRAPRGVTPTPRAHALVRAARPVVTHPPRPRHNSLKGLKAARLISPSVIFPTSRGTAFSSNGFSPTISPA